MVGLSRYHFIAFFELILFNLANPILLGPRHWLCRSAFALSPVLWVSEGLVVLSIVTLI